MKKRIRIKLSTEKMAEVMYAMLLTSTKLLSSMGFRLAQYSRKQNRTHWVEALIEIPDENLELFQRMCQAELLEPEQVHLNYITKPPAKP